MILTIDGPTSSGKSSAARLLAASLHFYHLNSGLLYRALAYLLLENEEISVSELADVEPHYVDMYLNPQRLKYLMRKEGAELYFDEKLITPFLRGNDVGQAASMVSGNAYVRTIVVQRVREIANEHNCVIDGRDVGSQVFPDAALKFYLTARLEKRAVRWLSEQRALGNNFTMAEAEREITRRDARDKDRFHSPLVIPQGAIVIDNSDLTLDQTVEMMLKEVKRKIS